IRRAGLRVREYKLVQLYKETFKPDLMILVSRTRLPGEVREDLEGRGITVVDGVEIGEVGKLSWVSEEIARRARPSSVGDLVEDLLTILRSRGVDASPEEVADAARRVLIDRIDEIISLLRDNK
ncbi:MAG: hypothetical protein GSR86_01475, partial [Desulfurococcales archaeon]|nr:hypothetical protein [Desulfurococcales archaeon]